ncbi:MAG: hypothetical protein E3J70_02600 [Candidatus Heimdallarchaeota archaeon]|nr:MAG: hypothetical protein E3J70_02600 [Candidatus Heimdallarchaeota archaeon]
MEDQTKGKNIEEPYFQLESDNLCLVGIRFANGFFLVISERESLKLGTMAISLPTFPIERENETSKKSRRPIIDRKNLSTATVIGTRNELYTKALAEKIVSLTGEMVYLSVNFQENNEELFLEAIGLIDVFLNENETK